MIVTSLSFFNIIRKPLYSPYFFFNDTATSEIYTLSLHDALPIFLVLPASDRWSGGPDCPSVSSRLDRKSTRLNSSHVSISYAVFCLQKKIRSRRYIPELLHRIEAPASSLRTSPATNWQNGFRRCH